MSTTETLRRNLATAVVALVFALLPAQAQQQRMVYNVGDAVEIDAASSGQWSKATVLEVKSLSGKVYGYVVRVDEGPAGPGQILRLPVSRFRPSATGQNRPSGGPFRVGDTVEVDQFNKGQWKRATIVEVHPNGAGYLIEEYSGPGVSGAVAQLPANQVRPWTGNSTAGRVPSPANPSVSKAVTTGQNPGQFKVGDRVMASSISAMDAPYRPCTVTAPALHGTYGLRCDPWQGRPYDDTQQFPEYVHAWPNATPAPNVGTCSFDVPQGTVSRTSTASAQLFQRVIYEHMTITGPKIGLTFTKFEMGKPFRNSVVQNGGLAEREFGNVPLGGTVYPIRSEYVTCADEYDGFYERTVVRVDWACMKDKFGDWSCPVYSTPQTVKREKVPK